MSTTAKMIAAFNESTANKFPEFLTPAEMLACLALAKRAMMNGEASVEAYYFAKEVLFSKLEMPSEAIN